MLGIREPDWFGHRLFNGPDAAVNLHIFPRGCAETERMVRFRDWLRRNAEDPVLYARSKRELALREWAYVRQYADAKIEVITSILIRARATPGP